MNGRHDGRMAGRTDGGKTFIGKAEDKYKSDFFGSDLNTSLILAFFCNYWFKSNFLPWTIMEIKPIMLIILIVLIKKVAQSCHLGNKPKFVQWHHNNMNQSKHLTLLIISRSPLNI